jgi:hypothetical protein
MFNIRCAKAEQDAEEEYWQNIEEEERYELEKNSRKCNFCNEFGHVYQMGILTCPLLKQTECSACGLTGHTPKFCVFLQNEESIDYFVQLYINEKMKTSTWANKVSQNLTEKERKQMVDDCIQSCKQNVDKYKKL